MAQVTTGWRYLLSSPMIYRSCMDLLGARKAIQNFVEVNVKPFPGISILDLGCGPATILDYLPIDTDYVGVDISQAYIEKAKEKYSSRGTFHCLSLESLRKVGFEHQFDLVLGMGVLHHLDNSQARSFFIQAYRATKQDGRCITIDPCRVTGQHWMARLLISLDRGKNVRTCARYRDLAEREFQTVNQIVIHNLLRIPYTHLVITCEK